MHGNDQLVLGLGEVGTVLQRIFRCLGYDPINTTLPQRLFEVLHVAFPYSKNFVDEVKEAKLRYHSPLVIIHSTVPIGTTQKIPGAVHSPILGSTGGMEVNIRTTTKWLGGGPGWVSDARAIMADAKLRVQVVPRAEITEALKLLCLARYGVDIAFSHYAQHVLEKVGGSEHDYLSWINTYNDVSGEYRQRAYIWPEGEHIGGHCVVPGTKLLYEEFPDKLLEEVLKYGDGPGRTK